MMSFMGSRPGARGVKRLLVEQSTMLKFKRIHALGRVMYLQLVVGSKINAMWLLAHLPIRFGVVAAVGVDDVHSTHL